MSIHHRIAHHVRKHKERFIAHVNEHQKKYIFGAGIVSWRAITKFFALVVIFLGMSKMGWVTGADYYDAEFYNSRTGNKIDITSLSQTGGREQNTWTDENEKISSGNVTTGDKKENTLYPKHTTQWQ